MPEALQRLLTIVEVADHLRLSEKTLRRLIARGRIPCVRIGRQIRFLPGDVFRWLEARKE
jgi:excisionase family DNA binding protein